MPADCDIFSYNGSQNTAKFRAGRISLPARTGNDNNNKPAVIKTAHANNISAYNLIPGLLILNVVLMKFIAPSKLDIPAKCNPNIAKSKLGPLWLCIPDKGGYKVHPVPTPFSIPPANKNNITLGTKDKKLILLSLGNLKP